MMMENHNFSPQILLQIVLIEMSLLWFLNNVYSIFCLCNHDLAVLESFLKHHMLAKRKVWACNYGLCLTLQSGRHNFHDWQLCPSEASRLLLKISRYGVLLVVLRSFDIGQKWAWLELFPDLKHTLIQCAQLYFWEGKLEETGMHLRCNPFVRCLGERGWMDIMEWAHSWWRTPSRRHRFCCASPCRRLWFTWWACIRELSASSTSRRACLLVCGWWRAWWWPFAALAALVQMEL